MTSLPGSRAVTDRAPTARLLHALLVTAWGLGGAWLLYSAIDAVTPPDRDRGVAEAVLAALPSAATFGCLTTALVCAALPVFGMYLLLVMLQRCLEAKPRPWSVPLFLGCFATLWIAIARGPETTCNGAVTVLAAALLGTVEVWLRGLRSHRRTAACMFGLALAVPAFVLAMAWGFRSAPV